MDFDSILPLLRNNEMYSALLHVFTLGLDDYVSPLELLLEGVMDAAEQMGPEGLNRASRRLDGVFQNRFERFGYKALLYLQYCFQGKSFPGGAAMEPEDRLQTVRPELLKFLLQPTYKPSSTVVRRRHRGQEASAADTVLVGRRADPYPYLSILVLVDAKALLDAFSYVLDAPDVAYEESSFEYETESAWDKDVMQPSRVALVEDDDEEHENENSKNRLELGETASSKSTVCPDRQQMVAILASVIRPTAKDTTVAPGTGSTHIVGGGAGGRQAVAAKNAFLAFVAKYLERRAIRAPKSLTFAVLSRMSTTTTSVRIPQEKHERQEQIISLLRALPPNSYDLGAVLPLMEQSRMTKVALLLHKVGAGMLFDHTGAGHFEWNGVSDGDGVTVVEECVEHFIRAIEYYVEDTQQEGYKRGEVFEYVKGFCVRADMIKQQEDASTTAATPATVSGSTIHGGNIPARVRRALMNQISDLVRLDAVLSAQLVAELFVDNLQDVLDTLQSYRDGGKPLFELLRAIISGDLRAIDSVAGPVLEASLTTAHHYQYLRLMADYHPGMVYKYLLSHDNYRPDECLKLCQARDIADASAYLLERMGNVSSALQLLLQTLESRLMTLKRVIRGVVPTPIKGTGFGWRHHRSVQQQKEDKAATLKKETEIKHVQHILVVALDLCERNSGSNTDKREHGSQLWFNVLDRLVNAQGFLRLAKEQPQHAEVVSLVLGDLLQLTMQRMVSNVPLSDLLRKFTIDYSGHQLGEFRHMLMSLLKTYSGDLQIASSAVDCIHSDMKQMSSRKGCLKVRSWNTFGLTVYPESYLRFPNSSLCC
jgi:hypothetical protein